MVAIKNKTCVCGNAMTLRHTVESEMEELAVVSDAWAMPVHLIPSKSGLPKSVACIPCGRRHSVSTFKCAV